MNIQLFGVAMASLFSATLIRAPAVGPGQRAVLEARFVAEIERLYGTEVAAAQSLHHWTDGGVDLVEALRWPEAERAARDAVLQGLALPLDAMFQCDVTDAFFDRGGGDRPPVALVLVDVEGEGIVESKREDLKIFVRDELLRLYGSDAEAAGALHASLDSLEEEGDGLRWQQACAIAQPIAAGRAGLSASNVRFTYSLNWAELGTGHTRQASLLLDGMVSAE